jgi:F-type H+-transporting ATPase subunit b
MHIDWWTLLLQAANFLVLVWLLQHFFYRPVLGIIADRQQRTESVIAEANAARAAAEQLRAELEQRRDAIGKERDQALEQAHASARAESQRVLEKARADAEKLLVEERQRLAQERAEAADALRREATELSLTIARRLLADAAAPGLDAPFVERLVLRVQNLSESERRRLRGQLVNGAALRLVTAEPVEPSAREALRRQLQALLGADAMVEFAENAALLAGAELRFPNAVLRYSWQSSLEDIAAELRRNGRTSGHA